MPTHSHVSATLIFFLALGFPLSAIMQEDPFLESDRPPSAQATLLPSVQVQDLHVTVEQNNAVQGSFSVVNREDAHVSDLYYELLVIDPQEQVETNTLVYDNYRTYYRHTADAPFSLAPNETKQLTLQHQVPALPDGDYRLRIQLKTPNGRDLGWRDVSVRFGGADHFIVVMSEAVIVTSTDPATNETREDWGPLEGPNVDPGTAFSLAASLTHIGSGSITVTPTLSVQRLLGSNGSATTTPLEPIVLSEDQNKLFTFPVTAMDQPGAYRVLLSFEQDGQPVSGVGEYRYVVRGTSVSLISAIARQFPHTQGESAVIDFSLAGAADRQTALENILVEVTLLDNNEIAGSTESTVSMNETAPAAGTATIVLTRDICTEAGLRIAIKDKDGNILDTYSTPLPDVPVKDCSAAAATFQLSTTQTIMGIAALAIIIIVLLVTWILQKRHANDNDPTIGTPPMTIAAILFLLGGITCMAYLMPSVEANGIQWYSSASGPNLAWFPQLSLYVNEPAHDAEYQPGTVAYAAAVSWFNCSNSVGYGDMHLRTLRNGGKVDWHHGHQWDTVAQRTLTYQGLRAGHYGYWTTDRLFATIDMTTPPQSNNTTLWTYVIARYSWKNQTAHRAGHDFTWLNFFRASPPSITFTANGQSNATVSYNSSATLAWTSQDADSCAASESWSGNKDVNGTESTANLTSDQTYTLTCSGPGGQASKTVRVTVSSPGTPSVGISTEGNQRVGQTITATGTVTHPNNVAIDSCVWQIKNPSGTVIASTTKQGEAGSIQFTPTVNGTYVVDLSCTDALNNTGQATTNVPIESSAFDPGDFREE